MSERESLLPCPLCGSRLVVLTKTLRHGLDAHCVECSPCGCRSGLYDASPEDAISAWNDRPAAETDALRAALRDVLDMFQVPLSVMGGEAYNIDSATLRRAREALAGTAPCVPLEHVRDIQAQTLKRAAAVAREAGSAEIAAELERMAGEPS